MTIIEPNKNKFRPNFLMLVFGGLIAAAAVLAVFAYNRTVSFEYQLGQQAKLIQGLQVKNSEMKNQIYAMLDLGNPDALAAKLGLISDKKPDYLAVRP